MILKHLCVKTMTKRLWISKIRISHIKKKKRKIETKNFTLKTTYSNNLLLLTKEIKIKIFCKIQRFGNRISQYFVSQSPSNKHRWSTDDETSSSNIPTGMSPTIVLLSSRFETIFQPWSLSFVTYVESREGPVKDRQLVHPWNLEEIRGAEYEDILISKRPCHFFLREGDNLGVKTRDTIDTNTKSSLSSFSVYHEPDVRTRGTFFR